MASDSEGLRLQRQPQTPPHASSFVENGFRFGRVTTNDAANDDDPGALRRKWLPIRKGYDLVKCL